MTTPTPEATEAGVASGMDTHDWELLKSQGDIGEAVEMAIRDALSVAAPLIAAQAKAEALQEAADELDLPGSTDVGYYSGYTDNGYNQAMSDAEEWLTDRAATIEGKSE